jgi:hypothetical protein
MNQTLLLIIGIIIIYRIATTMSKIYLVVDQIHKCITDMLEILSRIDKRKENVCVMQTSLEEDAWPVRKKSTNSDIFSKHMEDVALQQGQRAQAAPELPPDVVAPLIKNPPRSAGFQKSPDTKFQRSPDSVYEDAAKEMLEAPKKDE